MMPAMDVLMVMLAYTRFDGAMRGGDGHDLGKEHENVDGTDGDICTMRLMTVDDDGAVGNVHDDADNANGPQYGKDGGDRRW